MATYRWLAHDFMSNAALEELPLSVRSYGGVLNGAGQFQGEFPIEKTTARQYLAATTPERSLLYVERDGQLMDGYIIWKRRRETDEPCRLAGLSILSILKKNRIITDQTFTASVDDQFTIANWIVNHVQGQTGGNFGITTVAATSGVKRDRTFRSYERKNAGEALAELAAVNDGFDFAIDISRDVSGNPVKTLNLSYPRRGRSAVANGVVFELGKNVLRYAFDEDGDRSARVIDALGAGDGADMFISTDAGTDLLDAGWPLTADSLPFKDVTEKDTLIAHAKAARLARQSTPTFLELTIVPDDPDGGLGRWIVGDDVQVRLTDDQFPAQSDGRPGYEATHRILGYSVDVPDEGPELVQLTLGNIQG